MQRTKRVVLAAGMVALMGAGMSTASAMGQPMPAGSVATGDEFITTGDIEIVASGADSEGRWVEFTGTGNVTVREGRAKKTDAAGKTTYPEGGRWDYGSYLLTNGLKRCYSDYYHKYDGHRSSAQMDINLVRAYGDAGEWSRARVDGNSRYTCYAYYLKY